jgi:uncharacterized membrane protein
MMGGWGMMGGTDWFIMLVMGLFWLLLAALGVWGVIQLLFAPERTGASEILKRRYARGEITREEFEEAQAALR